MTKRKEKAPQPDDCFYSSGIICEKKNRCLKCGWNPVVDAARKRKDQVWVRYFVIDKKNYTPPIETMRLVF